MTKIRKPRLTDAGAKMLRNLILGRDMGAHIWGRSAHGGAGATTLALRRHGWVSGDGQITDAGRAALVAFDQSGAA